MDAKLLLNAPERKVSSSGDDEKKDEEDVVGPFSWTLDRLVSSKSVQLPQVLLEEDAFALTAEEDQFLHDLKGGTGLGAGTLHRCVLFFFLSFFLFFFFFSAFVIVQIALI